MESDDVRRAAQMWGDDERAAFYARGGLMWSQLGAVQKRINEKITGSAETDWVDYVKATHLAGLAPVSECLSLCCGDGHLERRMAQAGLFGHCLGLDAAANALIRARERAKAEGLSNIDYACDDLNTAKLQGHHYDLVVAHSALHHVAALERLADQVRGCLKPGGLLIIDDYVGPSRFQRSDRQLEACNAALRLLPAPLRRSVSWDRARRVGPGARRTPAGWARLLWVKVSSGQLLRVLAGRLSMARARGRGGDVYKDRIAPINAEALAIDDPTEAVRSQEILGVIQERFDIIERKPYGGTLLMPVLDDIAANFEGDDPAGEALLQMLFDIEDAMIAGGELTSDFVFMVARPLP